MSMPDRIPAIETHYGGCRFRSRLEARWAVFFDTLGIEWQYEPQGFELPSGRYLPDFLVGDDSGPRAWIEIKGPYPTAREQQLAVELALVTNTFVAILHGDIPRQLVDHNLETNQIPGINVRPEYSSRVSSSRVEGGAKITTTTETHVAVPGGWSPTGYSRQLHPIGESYDVCHECGHADFRPQQDLNKVRINNALTAARSARFEFGESGR